MARTNKKDIFESKDFWNEFESALEGGKLKRIKNFDELKKDLALSAKKTRTESKQISIRINKNDLLKLKAMAMQIGIPYQTLINSLIRKFVKNN